MAEIKKMDIKDAFKIPEPWGYESPISAAINQIATEVAKSFDDSVRLALKQQVSFEVNEEELIKALKGERDQFEKGWRKGYKAGYEEARRWHKGTEDPGDEEVLALVGGDYVKAYTWDDCGEMKWYADGCYDVPVDAWMSLPDPYVPEENDEE